MSNIDKYIQAATRENTRKSYRSAIEHYESVWGGYLPATADNIAHYIADYAPTLAVSTLKQRLAAIATWHIDQGFPDPTKAPHVKKVLKGIAQLHPYSQKRAKPLQLEQLKTIIRFIENTLLSCDDKESKNSSAQKLRLLRDRALILIGFWRAFRSDELTRIKIENIQIFPSKGMEIFIPRSKTDRSAQGKFYKAPALRQLCPLSAYQEWVDVAQLGSGPLFPAINQWGHIGERALHPASIISIIKKYCEQADIADAQSFSSHSLRRGFASWANANQWDTKTLMEYVGWKDVQSAMRYIEIDDAFSQHKIEKALGTIGSD
ncbi:site-specific integrase [Agarilytica rhodophyticola]|uniref:site-specific integrase n=1 Tax=Agarilytica rhodophyticola TaxID=1737490 RepID=UPI000CD992C2|nr:site-specific integrase [Agarilytica rhodophyticola]